MILTIDIGGTLIKTLEWPSEKTRFTINFDEINFEAERYEKIIITGGRSQQIIGNYKLPDIIRSTNELNDLGRGGSYLANTEECYVLGVGTGSPLVQISNGNIKHVIGTGIGAGTIFGLGKLFAGDLSIEELNQLAEKGDAKKLNISVGEIYENSDELGFPSSITAGNFAKINGDVTIEDRIAALMQMVGESLATLVCAASNSNSIVVIVGGGTFYPHFLKSLITTLDFYGFKSLIPPKALYANCYGALFNLGIN